MIILHKTNLNDGFKRVDPWRKTMEDIRIQNQAEELQITITAGIATYPIHGKTLEEIKKGADDALHQAKKAGRNIVKMPRENT